MTSSTLSHDAELAKLGRLLDTDEPSIEFLRKADLTTLRALRDQISSMLQETDAQRLRKLISASRLVPVSVAAPIGEKWFGPTLCARLVGLVDPKMGGQFARHLSIEFMADITARTDPRVVGELVNYLPLATMQGIAPLLLERDDYVTLSHFVGHLPPASVASILEAIHDDAAVVRIAQYVEDPASLDPVVALIPDGRLLSLIDAVDHEDLWVEGVNLFACLGNAQIERVAKSIFQSKEQVVVNIVDAFRRFDLWEQGIEVLAHLGHAEFDVVAEALGRLDRKVIEVAIDAFVRHDLWEQGLKILAQLSPEQFDVIAEVVGALDSDVMADVIAAADRVDCWEPLVHAAAAIADLPGSYSKALATVVAEQPPTRINRFESVATRLGYPGLLGQFLQSAGQTVEKSELRSTPW